MKKHLLALFLACGCASLPPLLASAHAEDLMATADSDATLRTFVKAVNAAGLTDSLRAPGPYTVFAPDNSAFARLPADTLAALMKDKARLSQVLNYHIIPGRKLVTELKPGAAKTIAGGELTLTSDNGMVTVNGADVIQSDLAADNGVIQIIDHVLMPAPAEPSAATSH
jgi:uncharacterized surface protein with fasciclin (FAS1) repeats